MVVVVVVVVGGGGIVMVAVGVGGAGVAGVGEDGTIRMGWNVILPFGTLDGVETVGWSGDCGGSRLFERDRITEFELSDIARSPVSVGGVSAPAGRYPPNPNSFGEVL